MLSKRAKRVSNPDYVNKTFDCPCCGGRFKVTKRTDVRCNACGTAFVRTTCPYCGFDVDLKADPHKSLRDKLTKFIMSQVAPIKAIADENVRLPMEHLLDDFNMLVQEDD